MSSQPVNPLNQSVPIVNPNGTPTWEFMRKWAQQFATNDTIPLSADPTAQVSGNPVPGAATTYMRSDAAPALSNTGVAAGAYGDTANYVTLTVDAQGRITEIVSEPLPASALTLTDGTHAVADVAQITVTGGVVGGTTPNATLTIPAGATGANPTATASDTAVNGSASTFMRSDSAPAVQKASSSLFGVVKPDGTSITAVGGVISAAGFAPTGIQFNPGFVPGRYYQSAAAGAVPSGTLNTTKDTLYAIPFYVPATMTFTRIGFHCSSGGAGNYELGIYNNANGVPTTLQQDLGSHTVTNSADNILTGQTITLSTGWYWLVLAFSNSSVLVFSYGTGVFSWLLGSSTISNTATNGITGAWTFSAGALPGNFPTVAYSAGSVPAIMMGT